MHNMFYNCYTLENIDLSFVDTKNVTDMSFMFYNCYNFKNFKFNIF